MNFCAKSNQSKDNEKFQFVMYQIIKCKERFHFSHGVAHLLGRLVRGYFQAQCREEVHPIFLEIRNEAFFSRFWKPEETCLPKRPGKFKFQMTFPTA